MAGARKPAAPDLDRSVSGVMQAVAREARDLHGSAERLQAMAGVLIERAQVEANDPLVEEAQALDALAQKLDALSGFLARLACDAPPEWRLDIERALAGVPLADLASRLRHAHGQAAPAAPFAPAGDCELF